MTIHDVLTEALIAFPRIESPRPRWPQANAALTSEAAANAIERKGKARHAAHEGADCAGARNLDGGRSG